MPIILIAASIIYACNRKNTPTGMKHEELLPDYQAEGYNKAVVKDMSGLDGCGYMFMLSDSTFLNPINIIKPEYKNEGMKVWLKYRVRMGVMTSCMKGKNIDIVGIASRKE